MTRDEIMQLSNFGLRKSERRINTNKRDWEKDWQMCKQATPEPWEAEGIGGIYMDGQRDCYAITHNGTRLNKPHFSYHDARFIAEARSSLPYWLQRVRELEKREERLLNTLRNAEIYIYGMGPVTVDELVEELRKGDPK